MWVVTTTTGGTAMLEKVFYTSVLVSDKGDDFQLVLWPGTPGQAEPAMGRPPASITIETDDVRQTVDELKSRGVEFVSDVLEFPWGYIAQFQDPDGNLLQVRQGL